MRAFVRSAIRTSQFIVLGCIVSTGANSSRAKDYVAWLLADQSNETTPQSKYSYNSNGSSISYAGANGSYNVDLFGLQNTAASNVQITAYNSSGWCNASPPIARPTGILISVQCYNAANKPSNTGFALLYQAHDAPFGSAGKGGAYLIDDQPTLKASNIANQSFNSTGSTNTIMSPKVGVATATTPGLTGRGGNPQVTGTHLSTEGAGYVPRCKPATWSTGASSSSVTVHCYDKTGVAHNGGFFLAYSVGQGLGVAAGNVMPSAWAWVNDEKNTNVYAPNTQYQYNGFNTGHLTAQKTGTGLYTVTIPGTITYASSVALVTATGPTNSYCNLADTWTNNAIHVACYAQGGVPADSPFEVSFQTVK